MTQMKLLGFSVWQPKSVSFDNNNFVTPAQLIQSCQIKNPICDNCLNIFVRRQP